MSNRNRLLLERRMNLLFVSLFVLLARFRPLIWRSGKWWTTTIKVYVIICEFSFSQRLFIKFIWKISKDMFSFINNFQMIIFLGYMDWTKQYKFCFCLLLPQRVSTFFAVNCLFAFSNFFITFLFSFIMLFLSRSRRFSLKFLSSFFQ